MILEIEMSANVDGLIMGDVGSVSTDSIIQLFCC